MSSRCLPGRTCGSVAPGFGRPRLKAATQCADTERVTTDNRATTYVHVPEGRQPAALRMNDNEAITEYQRLTLDLSDLEEFPWAYDENGVLYRCAARGLPFLTDEWISMPRALDSHTFEWFGCPGTPERAEHDRFFHLHRERRNHSTVA